MIDTQKEIIRALSELDDELDIYDYFISKALRFQCPDIRQPEHQIKGCVSGLWVLAQADNGLLTVYADSDSLIIRGIAAAICEIYTGMTPAQARACPITFLDGLDLAGELDDTRRSGLKRMIQSILSVNGGNNI